MTWAAVAIAGSAIVGAGASVYAGKKGADASKRAAKRASDTELQMYNQSRADLAPYRQAGYGALDMLSQLYGIQTGPAANTAPVSAYGAGMSRIGDVNTQTAGQLLSQGKNFSYGGGRADTDLAYGGPMGMPGDNVVTTGGGDAAGAAPPTRDLSAFYKSPDYDFRMREGLAGIGNSYAARGGALSGPAARASGEYAANLASGSFNDYVNRLASIAGIGQTATNTTAGLGANTAGNLSNIYAQTGAQRASTYGQMASGVNSAIQGGLQNWSFNNYLNRGGGGGGGSAPASGPLNLGPVWQPYQYRP